MTQPATTTIPPVALTPTPTAFLITYPQNATQGGYSIDVSTLDPSQTITVVVSGSADNGQTWTVFSTTTRNGGLVLTDGVLDGHIAATFPAIGGSALTTRKLSVTMATTANYTSPGGALTAQ